MLLPQTAERQLFPSRHVAPRVIATTQRNPGEPVRERGLARIGRQGGIGPDKDVMRNFLHHVASNMAGDDAADMLLIAGNQFHKKIHFSGQNPTDDLLIRGRRPCHAFPRHSRGVATRSVSSGSGGWAVALTQEGFPLLMSKARGRWLHCNLTGPGSD